MKPSSFQTTIENQFDYICKRAMEDERKNYMLYLSRIAKREVSFSDVGDYLVSQFATTDNYSTDFQIFTLNGLSVGVENDLLSEALRELPDKKREILLLFYFMDMSDSEIADLLKLNRSTVYRHRTRVRRRAQHPHDKPSPIPPSAHDRDKIGRIASREQKGVQKAPKTAKNSLNQTPICSRTNKTSTKHKT